MQDWFNKYMSLNILNHINGLKNNVIISTDTKKSLLQKIQNAFMIKVLENVGIVGIYLNIINVPQPT